MSLSIRSLLLPLAALLVVTVPALASAQPADGTTCWQRVLTDWKDGRIDGTYSSSCLRAAIVHMPEDLKIYGDAEDDITRLLNAQAGRVAASTPAGPSASGGSRSLEGRKAKTRPAQVRRVAAAPEQDASGGGFPYRTLLLILAAASALSVLGVASVRGRRG